MKKTYWFSKKQRALLDVLGQPCNYVHDGSDWVGYTVSTEDDNHPGTWPDYVQVAAGVDLPTKVASEVNIMP